MFQSHLKQLEQLGLDLNPVASLPEYREKVFALIPSLIILDSKDRQGEEREANDSDTEEEEGKIHKHMYICICMHAYVYSCICV